MKNRLLLCGILITIVCVILSISSALIVGAGHYASRQYNVMSGVFSDINRKYPDEAQNVLGIIKDAANNKYDNNDDSILSSYGYETRDFLKAYEHTIVIAALVIIIVFIAAIVATIYIIEHKNRKRIRYITEYLCDLNAGKHTDIIDSKHDKYTELEDEIYKTVTYLRQTREEADTRQKNYADNLANIAHQMKTPLTSMSLISQQTEGGDRLSRQIERLTGLEEALLLLSRLDAGTLVMDSREVDIYTMLQCTADSLIDMAHDSNININIENRGAVCYLGDMEWSIEACVNLVKNCIEYAFSTVFIDYSDNPLYKEIRIWDDGEGFAKQDIPHLFERFYTGSRSSSKGIGIGLALSKSIFEMQNGIIEAFNTEQGGACYMIRIYSH